MIPQILLFCVQNQRLLLAVLLIPHARVEIASKSCHKERMLELNEEVAQIVFALRILVIVIGWQLDLVVPIFVIQIDLFPQFFEQVSTWDIFDTQVQL